MKTQEELNELKDEVETLNEKIRELTPEELEQVNGGVLFLNDCIAREVVKVGNTIEAEGGIEAALGVTLKETN